ncbi:A24 family peptidase [uncultured Arthrobacter sp.]|uniref:A24 family peptidase n=1 Tax=uncultured Arthrobacter sp. TaxID=114050 RepID=UPI0032173A2D
MPDPAFAGSVPLLFIAGAAAAGLFLGVLGDVVVGRILPHLAGRPTRAQKITTAVAAAALCALLAWRFGAGPELPAFIVLAVIGIQLARIDIVHHLLPNRLVIPLLGAGIVLLAAASAALGGWEELVRALAGAVILFFFYFILALISPSSLGMGDVKLAAPLGLYLGYLGWSPLFYGGALGFVAGGLVSLALILKNRGNKPKEVAYGPSMLAAALITALLSA